MIRASRFIVLLVCVLSSGFSVALAQDWPQWRGPGRDGIVSGFTAPETWPKTLSRQWKITVGPGDATPALVGDRLYVFTRQGDQETLLCLNAADGKEVWKNQYAAEAVTGAAARHPGPRSSPIVADGKVITLGVTGILSCLDAADGKVAWRNDQYKGYPTFFTAMSPMVVDGACIAHLGSKGKGTVVALDLASGKPRWTWTGEGPAYASPVLLTVEDTKQIVLQTEKSLIALASADGKLLWQVPAAPQGRFFNSASPVVDGQIVIHTGQGKGTRAVRVQKLGDGFAAKEIWANEKLGTGYNTPVLKDGILYGISDRGSLFAIHAQTGKTAWVDATTRRDSFGSVLDLGSALLALPSNGELIAYKPSDKHYEELTRIKASDAQTYAHPVIAGKRIYIKDLDSLTLWTLP